MSRHVGRWLWPLALVAVGGGGMAAGLALGGTRPADSMPPAPITPTAPVRSGVMSDATALACTVHRDTATLAPPAISEAVTKIVTKRPISGTTVSAGSVLIEVSGRPIFLLDGAFGLYRTLKPGDKGPDVAMLQRALAQLDDGVSTNGTFDDSTAEAIKELYDDHGYTPPTVAQPATPAAPGAVPKPTTAQVMVSPAEIVIVPRDHIDLTAPLPTVGASVGDPLANYYTSQPYASCTSSRLGEIRPGSRVAFSSVDAEGVTRDVQPVVSQNSGSGPVPTSAASGVATPEANSSASTMDTTQPKASEPSAAQVRVDFTKTPRTLVPETELTGNVVLGTSSSPVLSVPVSAVHAGGGDSAVTVVDGAGRHEVNVALGMMVDGFVQVTPATGQRLAEGDQVAVGS